ncbi:MAG: hypothetical protein Q7V01_01430, partial [Vicinamibacterales bacterium]|nr:hypothetical protein [Vicinamibacterales bacterium]
PRLTPPMRDVSAARSPAPRPTPPSHGAGRAVAWIAALATLITLVLAAPVLRAPTERIFGLESAGRHHDPFTVMAGFEHPAVFGPLWQPLTDGPGTWLARSVGAVAACNILVLLSFPLSAVTAFLLARHLSLSNPAAGVVALAFAFSPFHIAHAAYHPHIAQTQWIPLYFLALWRCLDAPTRWRIGVLAAATGAVAFSNFYGGFVAAVLTPVAIAAHWFMAPTRGSEAVRRSAVTAGALAVVGSTVVLWAWWVEVDVLIGPGALNFPPEDLVRYGATIASYLIPPVAHPLFGEAARHGHALQGPAEGLVERQLTLGAAPVALALAAVMAWLARRRRDSSLRAVPTLTVVALAATWCSLQSPAEHGPSWLAGPAALIHSWVPFFRAYARFGVVTQLMIVLLAGVGAQWLWQTFPRHARIAVAALAVLAAAEYAVRPSMLWRDVLPTAAHRWVMNQPTAARAADCVAPTLESASVDWLTRGRVAATGGVIEDCTAEDLPATLAGLSFTHLIVRRGTWSARWFAARPVPAGLAPVARFSDSDVYAVTGPAQTVFTAEMHGFYPVEVGPAGTFRWMGGAADWIVVNGSSGTAMATVEIVIQAIDGRQQLDIELDGRRIQTLVVEGPPRAYQVGGLLLGPGPHRLTFRPRTPPVIADTLLGNGDGRALSCAFGAWHWVVVPASGGD